MVRQVGIDISASIASMKKSCNSRNLTILSNTLQKMRVTLLLGYFGQAIYFLESFVGEYIVWVGGGATNSLMPLALREVQKSVLKIVSTLVRDGNIRNTLASEEFLLCFFRRHSDDGCSDEKNPLINGRSSRRRPMIPLTQLQQGWEKMAKKQFPFVPGWIVDEMTRASDVDFDVTGHTTHWMNSVSTRSWSGDRNVNLNLMIDTLFVFSGIILAGIHCI